MTNWLEQFTATFLGTCLGVMIALWTVNVWMPRMRNWWWWRKQNKELGGFAPTQFHTTDNFPPAEERQAIGKILAYVVELGELGPAIQSETHEIIRKKVADEPYKLTPETARMMILLAGAKPPNVSAAWELLDEACDLLGEPHLERDD